MDLRTTYLGFALPHPLMPGASPLADDIDTVRRLEDAGAAAIVMRSLFEEQLAGAQLSADRSLHGPEHGEAQTYLPSPDTFVLGPDAYLEQLARIKRTVGVPVFASLNGTTPGGWLDHATLLEQAGADALELNLYVVPTNPEDGAAAVEERFAAMVASVKRAVKIPVAVKLSPFFTSLPHFARRLESAGADGIVVFNRFYQPDFDVEALEVRPTLHLSDPSELLLRLHALAILSGRVRPSLAASGGVHGVLDAVKAVMSGAHAVQMVSALLRRGPAVLAEVRQGLSDWLEQHEYASLKQAQGSMDLTRCPDPAAYERGNYMHILQTWRPGMG